MRSGLVDGSPMRERFLPLRLSAGLDAIVDGCCGARNRLTAKTGRIASLTDHQYLRSRCVKIRGSIPKASAAEPCEG